MNLNPTHHIQQISQIAIPVQDVARACSFYKELLGVFDMMTADYIRAKQHGAESAGYAFGKKPADLNWLAGFCLFIK
ncbi:VOC family protein [Paenibacillus caui]|uniref:VOC family protein n=1 Tax=Paenibacillus caui TaxID=2873927 RepID=UPI001CA7EE3F|nr:VOC family protein [Paenibacillus caui]